MCDITLSLLLLSYTSLCPARGGAGRGTSAWRGAGRGTSAQGGAGRGTSARGGAGRGTSARGGAGGGTGYNKEVIQNMIEAKTRVN